MTAIVFQIICVGLFMFGGLLTAAEPLHELKARGQKTTPRTIKGRSRRKQRPRKHSSKVKGLAGKSKAGKAAPLSDESKAILQGYLFGRDFPQYKTA